MKTKMTLAQRKALYMKARQHYYEDPHGKVLMSDAQFDALERSIERDDPAWHVLKTTGHVKKTDVPLNYFMPSLSKIYNWPGQQSNRGYIITPKLDGTALLLVYNGGEPVGLFTRGNGAVGGDVSYLLPLLNIPKKIGIAGEVAFRCEGIMRKDAFEERWRKSATNPKGFDTARAAVNGQFNRTLAQINTEILADIDLVVVGVYGYRIDKMLDVAKREGFTTVPVIPHEAINQSILEGLLEKARKGPYTVDGLVLSLRHLSFEYKENSFPAFAHAFKKNDEGHIATIREIIWQVSRFGRWTPVIKIDPVDFDGVTVQRATAHNVKLMYSKGIGVGAKVKIERAGEIIPYIVDVVEKAKKRSVPPGKTEWRGTHLYACSTNEDAARESSILSMLNFMRGLGIENVAERSIALLQDAGYTSVLDLLRIKQQRLTTSLQEVLGNAAGQRLAKHIAQIKTSGIPLANLAAYSGAMPEGIGMRVIMKLADAMPLGLLLTEQPKALYERIASVRDFGPTRARQVVDGCRSLRTLAKKLEALGVAVLLPSKTKAKPKSNKYAGIVAVWTGYRDEAQQQAIVDGGGTVGSSISGKTTHLFYNPSGKFMDKVNKARERGIKVMLWSDFAKGK